MTKDFITALPKAELHLHIEGSLEPELMFALAARNGVAIPYASVEEVRAAYAFSNLQDFLDIYYAGADVLRTRADFHDLAAAYFDRAAADGVVHAEIMFDPQTHTARGIPFVEVIEGLLSAMAQAQARHGITSALIMSFLRHLSEEEAFERITTPFREFMLAQVRPKDLALFADLAAANGRTPPDQSVDKVDLRILIPAFMISELRRGFEIEIESSTVENRASINWRKER